MAARCRPAPRGCFHAACWVLPGGWATPSDEASHHVPRQEARPLAASWAPLMVPCKSLQNPRLLL